MCNTQGSTKVLGIFLCGVTAFLATGGLWASRALAQCDPIPGASGPDAVSVLQTGVETFGCVDGIQAYFGEGGVCNVGTAPLPADMSTGHHGMTTQNLYRLADNRFEQIGMSWVKHDDWTTTYLGQTCGSLLPCTPCEYAVQKCCEVYDPVMCPVIIPRTLGVGCKDVYAPCRNGCQGPLGPRSQINPKTGEWPVAGNGLPLNCSTAGVNACRLQVQKAALDPALNPYFLEQQVITADEAPPAPPVMRNNNVSYKSATISACAANLCNLQICQNDICPGVRSCTGTACTCVYPLTMLGGTYVCQQPAIRAWKASDPSVIETPDIQVDNDGLFILAAKATHLIGSLYQYEYALYNMNSDRAAKSFSIPLTGGAAIDCLSIGFHDIAYHSGEELIYDDDPWTTNWEEAPGGPSCPPPQLPGEIKWTALNSDPTTNPNANALRWGTLYNFRFKAYSPPVAVDATIGLFKVGVPSSVTAATIGPAIPAECTPGGACCFGGTCRDAGQTCCNSQGGVFKGNGTDCQDCNLNGFADACELPIRACCLPPEDASPCIETTQACCENEGGTYLGGHTTCTPWPCYVITSGPSESPPEP